MTRPNGTQGAWSRPAPTSPVPAAILAALPADGAPIERASLIRLVAARVEVKPSTIATWIQDMCMGSGALERVGYGKYRRRPVTEPREGAG